MGLKSNRQESQDSKGLGGNRYVHDKLTQLNKKVSSVGTDQNIVVDDKYDNLPLKKQLEIERGRHIRAEQSEALAWMALQQFSETHVNKSNSNNNLNFMSPAVKRQSGLLHHPNHETPTRHLFKCKHQKPKGKIHQ